MDHRHIRAFIAVAEASSVTRAAERLHISQPPLTRQIQQLERELGLTLFVRHRHGVALTDAGRHLLDKARAWETAEAAFAETARQAKAMETQRIRVGIGWGLWDVVNRVRVEFAKEEPSTVIEVHDAHCYFDSDEMLRSDALDVAVARPPFDREFNVSPPLLHEPTQVVLAADHPLASRASVSVRDLADQTLLLWDRQNAPVLYDQVLALYRTAGLTPHTVPTPGAGPFNHAGIMLVASGKGIYFGYGVPLASSHPTSGVAVVPISDAGATIEVRLVSRKQASPVVDRFLACACRVYDATQARARRVS